MLEAERLTHLSKSRKQLRMNLQSMRILDYRFKYEREN
jgi:hypothetical protein